jgi:hypothetical protein
LFLLLLQTSYTDDVVYGHDDELTREIHRIARKNYAGGIKQYPHTRTEYTSREGDHRNEKHHNENYAHHVVGNDRKYYGNGYSERKVDSKPHYTNRNREYSSVNRKYRNKDNTHGLNRAYHTNHRNYENKDQQFENQQYVTSYGPRVYRKGPGFGFHGQYTDKCGNDGLYYTDETSFVLCSNGNSYVQQCAPGTRNSPYQKYRPNKEYNYWDLCDINLMNYGYVPVDRGYSQNSQQTRTHVTGKFVKRRLVMNI